MPLEKFNESKKWCRILLLWWNRTSYIPIIALLYNKQNMKYISVQRIAFQLIYTIIHLSVFIWSNSIPFNLVQNWFKHFKMVQINKLSWRFRDVFVTRCMYPYSSFCSFPFGRSFLYSSLKYPSKRLYLVE